MNIRDQIERVLKQHPLIAGAGNVICAGCNHVLGYPEHHLLQALCEVLDPQPVPEPVVDVPRKDPRESSIVWEAS